MVLIADSGSSKTDWRLLVDDRIEQAQTIGLNPNLIDSEILQETINSLPFLSPEIRQVFFYGAGCGSPTNVDWLKEKLQQHFPNSIVEVKSDLEAAALATLEGKPGLVGILGTGSNLAYYDGQKLIQKSPSLGYILGDEGSGSYMGKLFLSAFLKGELDEDLCSKIKIDFQDVIQQVYHQKMPNKYLASFSKLMFRHRYHPQIAAIIQKNFSDWFQKDVLKYSEKEIAMVGSIAYYFNTELRQLAASYNFSISNIIESPISALCLYHQKIKKI
jgi:glucosamine kinase